MPVLLTTAFCPPVEYFAVIASEFDWHTGKPAEVVIEACEHYQKQSWRNRCRIYAADGSLDLNFPIRHNPDPYVTPVSEVLIDWSSDWLTRHKRAIVSAYRTSPYFEYYQDEFFAVLDSRKEHLLDYNTDVLRFFLSKFHIDASVDFTKDYVKSYPSAVKDLRAVIHPKHENCIMAELGLERPYYQVFADRFGFIPHLSAMDLLFNEGPDSLTFLTTSDRK